MPLSVGDATLSFLADTTQLDQAFARIPEQADASMSAAADSVDKVGIAAKGVSFELDATGSNAAYAGGMIKESMDGAAGAMAVGQNGAVKLGEVMNLAGEKTRESFYQARGEMMLIDELIGVRLPKHIVSFIAELPGVGAALSAAFTATAVIFLVEMIAKAIDHHEQLAKAAEKAALATENLAIKERDHTASMELANLKLDDQIAKLEHRPEQNKLKEALLEAGIAADQLAEKFAKDFEQMDDEIVKTTSFFGRLTQDMHSWWALLTSVPGENFGAALHKVLSGTKDVQTALDVVHAQVLAINKLRAEPIANTEEKAIKQQEALAAAYELMGQKAKAAMEVVQKQAPENTDAIEKLSSLIVSSTAAQVDAGKTIENVHKHVRETALETQAAIAAAMKKQDEEIKKQGKAVAEEAAKEEKLWETTYKIAVANLQDSEKAKIAATQAGSKERIAAIDAALKEEQSKGLQATQYYKELEKEKQKAIQETITVARDNAQKELREAQTDAKEKLQVLVAGLKEQEAALQASEQKGLITKKQLLIETEALQKQETAAKIAALKLEAAAEKEALDIEEQALIIALGQITDADQYAKALQKVLDIEKQRDALAKKFASDEHVASIQGQKDLETTDAKLAQLEKTWTTYFNQMHRDLPSIGQAIRTELQGSIDKFNKQFSADFANMIVTGKGFGQAMKSLGQDISKSFISMLTEMLLKWVETQIAMKVLGISSAKTTASAEIAASAATAGANMVASWSMAPWPIDTAAPAMGAMAYANAMAYEGLVALATGGLVTGPTMAMVGEKGAEAVLPLTDPAAMERVSNALLSSPMMRVASASMSDPTAIALASNVRQGGLDDAAMGKLGDLIGAHLDASGGAGDTHNHHYNIKGLISPDNMTKVMSKMSKMVQQNRATLHCSNSLRITRRSQ